jgi:hypothetical protein
LMGGRVPALTDHLRHLWPIALVGWAGVSQRQPCDRLLMVEGQAVGHPRADSMGHYRHPLMS